jgi:Ca-activated chloride channel family protein
MVRKIPPIQKPVKPQSYNKRMTVHLFTLALFLTVVFPANPCKALAESLTEKNREGNQLFTEGKYEEAEKAYLEAQVKNPGRPEILYNLGNSLVKQAKYDKGIQALSQSAGKGDKRIKTDSLYNSGNALYSKGDFRGSAEAFIEALKLDPDDKDAKHNLELALEKLKQQEQKQQDSSRDRKNSGDQDEQKPGKSKENQPQPESRNGENPDTQKNQKAPAKMQPGTPSQREGSITREQAQKILDAVRNQELEQQRKLMEARSRPKTNKRDW